MSDQPGEDVPSETAQAWDSVRRVREPVAWALLAVAAVALLVSAWQLFGLPGDGLPAGPGATAASPTNTFDWGGIVGAVIGAMIVVVVASFLIKRFAKRPAV
jgi:hypothetical protein